MSHPPWFCSFIRAKYRSSTTTSVSPVLVLHIHQIEDSCKIIFGGELDGDLALLLADLNFGAGVEVIGQTLGEFDGAR